MLIARSDKIATMKCSIQNTVCFMDMDPELDIFFGGKYSWSNNVTFILDASVAGNTSA